MRWALTAPTFASSASNASSHAGFIRAERQRTGAGVAFLMSAAFCDLVTVTVLQDAGSSSLRVLASSQIEEDGRHPSAGILTSDVARASADAVLARCAGLIPTK